VWRTLRRDGTFAEPKTRSRRAVALTPQTAALFAWQTTGKLADELVFTGPGGGPWRAGDAAAAVSAARRRRRAAVPVAPAGALAADCWVEPLLETFTYWHAPAISGAG
jgi:hypothetical protein